MINPMFSTGWSTSLTAYVLFNARGSRPTLLSKPLKTLFHSLFHSASADIETFFSAKWLELSTFPQELLLLLNIYFLV